MDNESLFKSFAERRDKINKLKDKEQKHSEEINRMQPWLSFESYIGMFFYTLLAFLAFSVFSFILFVSFVVILDKVFNSISLLSGNVLGGVCFSLVILSFYLTYKFIKPKYTLMKTYLVNKPKIKILYKEKEDLNSEKETLLNKLYEDLAEFDMKSYLDGRSIKFFNSLGRSELDLIDDYKNIMKNNRNVNNYVHFNTNQKTAHILIND